MPDLSDNIIAFNENEQKRDSQNEKVNNMFESLKDLKSTILNSLNTPSLNCLSKDYYVSSSIPFDPWSLSNPRGRDITTFSNSCFLSFVNQHLVSLSFIRYSDINKDVYLYALQRLHSIRELGVVNVR